MFGKESVKPPSLPSFAFRRLWIWNGCHLNSSTPPPFGKFYYSLLIYSLCSFPHQVKSSSPPCDGRIVLPLVRHFSGKLLSGGAETVTAWWIRWGSLVPTLSSTAPLRGLGRCPFFGVADAGFRVRLLLQSFAGRSPGLGPHASTSIWEEHWHFNG